MSAGRQQLDAQRARADLRDGSKPARSTRARSAAAGGRVASCARRRRPGSDGRWLWRVAGTCFAHSQSIAEQGDSQRSGEGGSSIGMLQKISSSGGRVGEGPATGGSVASDEPSAAPWVPPGDISQVLRCVQPRRLTQAASKRRAGTFSRGKDRGESHGPEALLFTRTRFNEALSAGASSSALSQVQRTTRLDRASERHE